MLLGGLASSTIQVCEYIFTIDWARLCRIWVNISSDNVPWMGPSPCCRPISNRHRPLRHDELRWNKPFPPWMVQRFLFPRRDGPNHRATNLMYNRTLAPKMYSARLLSRRTGVMICYLRLLRHLNIDRVWPMKLSRDWWLSRRTSMSLCSLGLEALGNRLEMGPDSIESLIAFTKDEDQFTGTVLLRCSM